MAYLPDPHVRAAINDDGAVLMHLLSGRYYTFNATGTFIWQHIQAGEDRATILEALRRRFPGCEPRIEPDLDLLLDRLQNLGLIISEKTAASPESSTAPTREQEESTPPFAVPVRAGPLSAAVVSCWHAQRHSGGVSQRVLAYAALIIADICLKILGFPRFYRAIRSVETTNRVRGEVGLGPVVTDVCTAVDAAARLYPRRAWCLQRSAVATWLLRRKGIPAELAIGVRRFPFLAHAWVEVSGQVVNDDRRVQRFYQVIERC